MTLLIPYMMVFVVKVLLILLASKVFQYVTLIMVGGILMIIVALILFDQLCVI